MKSFRPAIIRLFEEGKKISEIARLLNLPRMTVSDAVKRYQETGSNNDRVRSGRPRTSNTSMNRKRIKGRIQRNPKLSTRKLAKSTGVSRSSVQRILKNHLGLKAFKLQKAHLLTDTMKATRLKMCKALKRRFAAGRHKSILFSDEKLFTIEQSHNHQNDRIWAIEVPLQDKLVNRSQKPKSVMVWAGVTSNGKTPLIFVEEGVKINQKIYQEQILESKLLPWAQGHFKEENWAFQQDSAPAHKARITQDWISANFPDFISSQEWPPYSPDLNPLDYAIWGILESKACAKPHKTIESLKQALKKAWDEISLETLGKIIDNFPHRLKLCIDAEGGHFEQK
jgi:inhibitor of nuclear factor kappa-B kinase subunit alpha